MHTIDCTSLKRIRKLHHLRIESDDDIYYTIEETKLCANNRIWNYRLLATESKFSDMTYVLHVFYTFQRYITKGTRML